jgi:hypothetical protein
LGDDIVHAFAPNIDVFAEATSDVITVSFSDGRVGGEDQGLEVATRRVQCGFETGFAGTEKGSGDLSVRVKDGHASEEIDDLPERREFAGGVMERGKECEEHVGVGEMDLGLQ